MSIKSGFMELYVGKKDSNLFTITGRRIKITYADLKSIEYCFPNFGDGGYIDFIYPNKKTKRFCFTKKANDKISRTIDLIRENNEDIWIEEKHTENLRFYQRAWFTILMMFCCCFPLGLFLMWYYKKFLYITRIIITVIFVSLGSIYIHNIYTEYVKIMNSANELRRSIQDVSYNTSDSSIDEASPEPTTEFDESQPKTVFNVGDVYESDVVTIMYLDSGEFTIENEFMQPESGNKYIYAEFSIENIGDSDYYASSTSFHCFSDDTECPQKVLAADGEMTVFSELSSGRNAKGKIFYEVPVNAEKIEFEFETDIITQDKIYFNYK
ncbi:DUF4352 domain-containing protein [Clostridium sp. HBUAS56010]|uniref:DUF4352 domain-containing protein n=1 Tax=Clostridium sp. HBUAS56010 TaxID=2571127 RepID=UPI001177B834|nr:DUF4352 domain-containing protein [Clostridium sp. HBUAS56010]